MEYIKPLIESLGPMIAMALGFFAFHKYAQNKQAESDNAQIKAEKSKIETERMKIHEDIQSTPIDDLVKRNNARRRSDK